MRYISYKGVGIVMSDYKNFYDKEQMSDNVDALMSDMTETTLDRRRKDEDALAYIRDRQHGKEASAKSKSSIFGKIKKAVSSKKKSSLKYDMEEVYRAYGESMHTAKPANTPAYDNSYAEEATVVMDEEDDDATEVMGENFPLALLRCGDRVFELFDGSRLTIGSKRDANDVVIDSRRVSRSHAEIVCRDGEIYISDRGSTNGTYINGSHETVPKGIYATVKPGDSIILADTEIYICEYGGKYD